MFSIWVPCAGLPAQKLGNVPVEPSVTSGLQGLRVLCLDNDPEIIEGMQALLSRWGVSSLTATTVDEALEKAHPDLDVLLVDYHLHDRLDGLEALEVLAGAVPLARGALLTADGSHELKAAARERGYPVLTKPVKPASLRAFLLMSLEQRHA